MFECERVRDGGKREGERERGRFTRGRAVAVFMGVEA